MEECSRGDVCWVGPADEAHNFHSYDIVQISATLPQPPAREAGKCSLSVAQMRRNGIEDMGVGEHVVPLQSK